MYKMVATCFKAIIYAILFVFIFDMVFYMYRALSVNQRMESIMASMKKEVMENNYLPEGSRQMYDAIFIQLADDMNNGDVFIQGFNMNYSTTGGIRPHDAVDPTDTLTTLTATKYDVHGNPVTTNILRSQLDLPADYGDIMVAQLCVGIVRPMWGWSSTGTLNGDYNYSGEDAKSWTRINEANRNITRFYYTEYIPCLNYQSISKN